MSNRLPPEEYKKLCILVLRRDHWKCRCCGRRDGLHVHHIVYRSQGGLDVMENLIALCHQCHDKVHNHLTVIHLEGKEPGTVHTVRGANALVWFEVVGLGSYLS